MAESNMAGSRSERASGVMRPAALVVPVAGAGVAISAGLSTGAELAAHLLEHFDARDRFPEPTETLPLVVDFLLGEGVEEADVCRALASRLQTQAPETSPLIAAMIRVPSRFIVTLNFDLSIEVAERERGREALTLSNDSADLRRALKILTAKEPPKQLTVLHLHGTLEDPAGMVLGGAAYGVQSGSGPVSDLLYELAVHKVLGFYGTTLDEPYLLNRLEQIPHRGPHALWCRDSERAELIEGRIPILASRSNIYIGTVKHFEDLPATLEPLTGTPAPTMPRVPPAGLARPVEHYVVNSFVDRRRPNDPDDLALVSFGLKPKREVRPDPTEDDVLGNLRTIILGEPGSGKSALLRSLAARSRGSRVGVFIRLADVGLGEFSGPRDNLARWSEAGRASVPGADVSADAIGAGRYHFFLDGLDEVPSGRQEDFAKRINQLASEAPEHAFTVSTRPMPWLELLSIDSVATSDWEQLGLQPDIGWRDRYLAERGVSLEILEAEMPALADMFEVLITPFYLRYIVDLHEEGRLGGQRDVGDLLSSLIDSAIEREEGALELDPTQVRTWLRRVALAAAISGARTLSADDLRRLPAPADAGVVDPVALARALSERLLIAEENVAFSFHHRLFGEQLAAEALIEHGPAPELLDCFVPYIDKGLSGVRPDAVVPVCLACLRSAEWRKAVAERDPITAARATPRDASVRERSAALATLWGRAVSSQVWVWEYGTAFSDDAEAMTRLIRGLPSGATAREMRKAIDEGTSQDQGNAVRVLSRAGASLKGKLRAVLGDSGRNGVVLRQAALAAADLGYEDLMEDITEMLVGQTESVVHQDGIIALRKLMGDSPRLDLYRRLMGGPEAGYAYTAGAKELDPPERMLLLGAYLEAENDARDYLSREDLRQAFADLRVSELSSEVLEAATEVALLFDLDRSRLIELKEADPEAALRRLAEMFARPKIRWYEVIDLAALYDPEELAAAGISNELIRHADQRRRAREEQARLASEGREAELWRREDGEGDDEEEVSPEPTLAKLLGDQESDPTILNNSRYFAPQVADLDEQALAELRRRLALWWPGKPFFSTITREGPKSWRQEARAAAWIWLGPSAKPPISSGQWGQLASCGILFGSQSEWLREAQGLAGIYEAVAALGDDGDPERWGQLFECCTDPLPNYLLERCAETLSFEGSLEGATSKYRLIAIAERFVDAGREDLARTLGARLEDFARILPAVLAAAGDQEAQGEKLGELRRTVEQGELPEDDRLEWLAAISSPNLLPELFAILRSSYGLAEPRGSGVTSGFDLHDVLSPTIEAIIRIGGRAAVEGYDRLIASGGDLRWLSRQRSRIADSVLDADGRRFAPAAADRVGLPLIGDLAEKPTGAAG